MFITLEGGEGAGKSTQLRLLAERLRAEGVDTVTTREPGGSPKAERLRDSILHGDLRDLGPCAELVGFAAARADHLREVIRPALARGATVLCDRFVDSTRVYQGMVEGVPAALIRAVERVVVGDTMPDLTIVLDLPASAGSARAAERRQRGGVAADRFEREGIGFHERVRAAFLTLARAEPGRCLAVDAGRSAETIAAELWAAVDARRTRLATSAGRSVR